MPFRNSSRSWQMREVGENGGKELLARDYLVKVPNLRLVRAW